MRFRIDLKIFILIILFWITKQIEVYAYIMIFAFIGIVVAVGYVLVANMLDTTIKSVQDIEKNSGVTVLASIPIYDINENKGKRGGKRD